jgi:hypothetical protein
MGALKDPLTWGPATAALALQIDDADHAISDWAVEENPVFGSVKNAEDARGYFGSISDMLLVASMVATPGGDEPGEWVSSKVKGSVVQLVGVGLAFETVGMVKAETGRERPLAGNNRSFPSEHAARLAVNGTLTSRNLRSLPMSNAARTSANGGLTGLAAMASWARIEAGGHYPSDALVGIAIGRFFGTFINDAFLGLDHPDLAVDLAPATDGMTVSVAYRF